MGCMFVAAEALPKKSALLIRRFDEGHALGLGWCLSRWAPAFAGATEYRGVWLAVTILLAGEGRAFGKTA